MNIASARAMVSIRLAGHWVRQEADEVARMSSLHGDADFAVGFKSAYARTVAGTGIDDNERTAREIDFDTLGRDDPHQRIIDRLRQLPAIHDQFGSETEDVRSGFREMLLYWSPRRRMMSMNSTLRCPASTMYSTAEATRPGTSQGLMLLGSPSTCSDYTAPVGH